MADALYAATGLDEDEKETEDNATLKAAEVKLDKALFDLLEVSESLNVSGNLVRLTAKKEIMKACLQKANEAAGAICGVGDNEQLLAAALQKLMEEQQAREEESSSDGD